MNEAETRAELIDLRFTYDSNGLGVYAIDMASSEEGPERCRINGLIRRDLPASDQG